MSRTACELCGDATDVQVGLAYYKTEVGYRPIDRCRDHTACQARVEARGEEWPLENAEQARLRALIERGREP
jgi:hypothetical protein